MNKRTQNSQFKLIRAYHTGVWLALTDWILILPVLHFVKCKTTTSLTLDYQTDRKAIERDIRHGAFFITNHRDICMDAAWLSLLLRCRYGIRPYIGMGDNLFKYKWIEILSRINRIFVVIRGGTPREIFNHSVLLSQYIQRLRHRHKSIWLAQREGRAKNSNDLTQPSVLKMLTLGREDFLDAIREMNICPVSLSYEYDPCDYLKAAEMQLKRDNPNWHKGEKDDIISMRTGICGRKGRVVFRLTPSINPELEAIRQKTSVRNEQIKLTAELIDHHIHSAYEHFERGEEFDAYIESRLAKIDIPNKDEAFLRERLYEMYSYPERNRLAALGTDNENH